MTTAMPTTAMSTSAMPTTAMPTTSMPPRSAEPEPALELRFVEPMPGFETDLGFTLSEIDPDGILLAMRSVRDPGLRFVVSPSEFFFADYRPQLPPAVSAALGADPDDLRLLVVLTIADELLDATANLRAPIVMAASSGTAMQVVLEDDSHPMHQPLG